MSISSSDRTSRVPPIFLVDRVLPVGSVSATEHLESFFHSGQRSMNELQRALLGVDRSLETFTDVLDWGCGPGRVTLRVIESYPHLKVTGIDTDRGSIEWLTSAVPESNFHAIDPMPPTSLAPASFDLVINHSVLTHIDVEPQRAWMAEIARLLRPNGIFVTSVHGVHAFIHSLRQLENGFSESNPWIAAWRANRFVFVQEDTFTGSTHHDGYHTTFQDPAGLEAIGAYEFEPLATLHKGDLGFQDLLVFRRRTASEALERRTFESEQAFVPVAPSAPADDDSRLSRLERVTMLASISLNQLGRQIGRLEESMAAEGMR